MPDVDDDKTPAEVSIPSTTGIVARAGTKPFPIIVDPDHTGVPLWNRKPVRDAVAGAIFRAVAFLFPKSPWALAFAQLKPIIQGWIDEGAK